MQTDGYVTLSSVVGGRARTPMLRSQPIMTNFRHLKRVGLGICAGFVVACSGGGGDGTAPAATGNPPPAPANNPPTISGTPQTTVTEGQPYSFTPAANDPDGDTLTFAIVSPPVWANFDTATGALTGTPQAIHIGTTVGVTISVTDGMDSASLPAFNLEVQQVQLGSATVSWDVPTTNADGSLLTDLAGYEVHYGTSSGNYSTIAQVNDPNATDVTLNSLQPGTWFFAVKAVDQTGNASAFSAEVSKVIP